MRCSRDFTESVERSIDRLARSSGSCARSPYAAELRRLQSAIEKIGSSRVHVLPVYQSADADRALGEIATASLEAELHSLQAEISSFLATPPDRTSTLPRRLEALRIA
jgi:hypothetical protein